MKICIFERSNEKNHFSKTEILKKKKKQNNTIIRTSKYESRSERKFGVAAVCLIHADVGSSFLMKFRGCDSIIQKRISKRVTEMVHEL